MSDLKKHWEKLIFCWHKDNRMCHETDITHPWIQNLSTCLHISSGNGNGLFPLLTLRKIMFTFLRKSQTSFGNECWFLLVFLCKYCFFNLYYIVRFIVLGCLLCCSTAFLQCNPLPKLFDLSDKQHLPFSPWLTIL